MTHTRSELTALLRDHGLKPSRALGQNFVVDPNTVRRVARLADVGPGDQVLEIGAGLGSLTLALVETGATVHAMEIDRFLLEPLRSVVEPLGVRVHHADALHADYDEILGGEPAVVVANLPYNVATPLVLHLLESQPLIRRLLVMVQKEVGERMAAHAGDEAYGAVSLRVQYFADAKVVGKVPPSVFVPRPNVDSVLVSLVRRDRVRVDPGLVSEEELFSVIRTAFGQRRKMLRRSLAAWKSEGVFERSGVAETRRPEELTLEEFAALVAAR
ncbi:MAG TPA: 16S rRNA (adenine(1518)-N(6)/adenine(1519)-N(6))-dimethyltransferase RsmA [Acidimicrobiales bacterium]|nr:16S rRNA (adenine(1518)-N(6)/adenine(1519)-N(6))-dimethyltransferase RsmA [Acidimicrobiales bacterium]